MNIEIYQAFGQWLDDLLENNEMPGETKAFNFNLYEESIEESIYSIQLIAACCFDENDDEWACSEVWSSEENIFCVDTSDEEKGWQTALELITSLVNEYLDRGKYSHILKASQAVGIGFVDGDLSILYRNKE